MFQKNAWLKYDEAALQKVMEFNEGYKDYITKGKTERLCVKESVKIAEANGFKPLESFKELKKGDKVYSVNKNKNIALFVIGEKEVEEGLHILGAHIDSPRLDLKQNPLYERTDFAYLDTHYYGGVKKYQWVTTPLALCGVVVKKDGTVIDVCIGEDENDPIVVITDLLIHLSATQMRKTADVVIEGEDLDVLFGSMPLKDAEKEAVKANVLNIIKEKYGFEEEDFVSAEIEVVPAGKARDCGLDRSLVAGYGHDDRVCGYTSLMALIDAGVCEYTTCCILVDKEEVGSIGATGAQSVYFENVIAELINLTTNYSDLKLRKALTNSKMLSSDVSAGYDPIYAYVNEARNTAYLGKGLCINKYTGSRGKGGCNDANPEFIAEIRNIFEKDEVNYQTAELGKVDQGGGGTIAYILGNYNMNVIDAGVAVLNMHAPLEVVSKADVYEAYKGYMSFLKNIK